MRYNINTVQVMYYMGFLMAYLEEHPEAADDVRATLAQLDALGE